MERDEWVIGAVLLMAMLGLSAFNIWFMHDVTERLKINKPTPATSGGSRMARKWEYATVSGLEVDFSDEKALEEYLNIMDESGWEFITQAHEKRSDYIQYWWLFRRQYKKEK